MLRKRWCGQIYLAKFSPIRKQRHENVLVYSGPHFFPSSWSVLSQENIFGRPQESQGSNPNITLGTNAVTCRQNFYGKYTDRDVVDKRRSCHGFTMVFSLLYHLSLSRKHRLKTLQIGLNLSSYLRLKEGKKVVAVEVNIGKKINPTDVECYSPAKSSITSLLWCLLCNAKHYSFWNVTNFIIFFKSSSNFSSVRMPSGSPM